MKLQKHISDKVNGKTYHKYVVVIPEKIIKKAKLKEGDELEPKAEKGRVVLRKR